MSPRMPGAAVNRRVGACPTCGKQRYATRRDARHAARDLHPDATLRAYQCGGYWHYGHTPEPVRRGLRPAGPAT